ncbi:PREDICTED: sialic acid-binding Ig-like lectin 14 isoform X3 [Myotis brandtii]|uniref:sialic acid-binding Ig-like lectin 14 isoform X3 n=1 Tax=Myotis brandtii TaxID=109478 RepID=UPI0007040B9C|nr:PREDICTED: sialic acid-binding Ig-like lectin 14 isoform X3 [Myotis brandtii]
MVPLLLLPLLWGGSLQQQPGYTYELRVQESVTVQEGLCVHVPCSFSYPWSSWSSSTKVYTYWYRDRDDTNRNAPVATSNQNKQVKRETQGRFFLANPTTNNCSLQIRDARRSDAGCYFFRVEIGNPAYNILGHFQGYKFQGYNYQDKMLDLQVTDKPHIQIPEPLESGRHTELACSLPRSCESGQHFTFSWAGAAVDSRNTQNLISSVLTFTPRPRDHGTNLTCQVKVQQPPLTAQKTIRLDVSSFKNLQTTSLSILEGEALRLRCEADSNPPGGLSWFRGSPGLNATPLSSTAILELPRVGPAQEGEFTCQARHPLGSHRVSVSLSVVCSPPCRCVTEEQQGSWPLVLTLIRGALMGAGFLLTYVLTWLYYTRMGLRCGHQARGTVLGHQRHLLPGSSCLTCL